MFLCVTYSETRGRENFLHHTPHALLLSLQGKWSFLSVVMAVAVVAWLLDRQQTPMKTPVQTPGKKKKRNTDMAGSYSIADSNVDMAADDALMEE